MSVQVSYKKQFVLGFLLLIIFFVVLELAVNIYLYNFYRCSFEEQDVFKDANPEINRKMCIESLGNSLFTERIYADKGTVQLRGEIDDNVIYINSEGFRGPEFSQEKPENTYRIFFIGGSTAFGWGVLDNQTISHNLQNLYDDSHLDFKVEIINAGQLGWWSFSESQLIKKRLLSFEPGLFIVYDGWNDARYYFVKNDPRASPEEWKKRWIEICDLGKKYDYQTIIVLQPLSNTGNKILTIVEYHRLLTASESVTPESFSQYAQQLSSLKENCTLVADLRGIFDGIKEPIYYDFGHTGYRGNEIIAEKLHKLSLPIVMEQSKNTADKHSTGATIEINYNLDSNDSDYFLEQSYDFLRDVISQYKTPKISHLIFKT